MKSICIGLLAGAVGCALAVPAAATAATKEKVLYSFGKGTDGSEPEASLINVKGTLYGTTYAGGAHGDGTVFSFDPTTGKEKVLYSFCRQLNCADGQNPKATLTEANGKLYGTTYNGGADSLGSVFAVDLTTGKEKVLHSFGSGTDGVAPTAGLLDVNGTLYGTTFYGGTSGLGTVFSLDPTTGAETVLYSFLGGTLVRKRNGRLGSGGGPSRCERVAVRDNLFGRRLWLWNAVCADEALSLNGKISLLSCCRCGKVRRFNGLGSGAPDRIRTDGRYVWLGSPRTRGVLRFQCQLFYRQYSLL